LIDNNTVTTKANTKSLLEIDSVEAGHFSTKSLLEIDSVEAGHFSTKSLLEIDSVEAGHFSHQHAHGPNFQTQIMHVPQWMNTIHLLCYGKFDIAGSIF